MAKIIDSLVEYMLAARQAKLPEEVVQKGKSHTLDSLAAIVSGSTLKPGQLGLQHVRAQGGKEECSVLGSNLKTTPILAAFANGIWSGPMTFYGAGGAVSFNVLDFSSPPHFGTSNTFTVQPGPAAKLQVLLPGETARGGTADGKEGAPTPQSAGTPFTLTVRAVDAYWNPVSGVNDRVALGSDDEFAGMPAETTLSGGQRLFPVRLFRSGGGAPRAAPIETVRAARSTSLMRMSCPRQCGGVSRTETRGPRSPPRS